MSLGTVFYVIALFLFFLAGVGSALIPSPIAWGLAALTLGLMMSGVTFAAIAARRQP